MTTRWSLLSILALLAASAAACGDASEPGGFQNRGGRPGSGGDFASGGDGTATDGEDGGDGTGDGGPGTPQSSQTCTSCHGDDARTAVAGADPNVKVAPPRNGKGETGATARGVGAHQAHVNKASALMASPLACAQCHVVPTSTSHSNGKTDVTFGALAKTGGVNPAWSATGCAATYCHGNFPGGATAAVPAWTGAAMTCTSCHEAPPQTGDHRRGDHNVPCSDCHGTGFTATTVNKALHLNGAKNAGGPGSKITTWNAANRSCTPTCHGTETW